MEKEIDDYLMGVSKLLNGQLRNAFINEKARQENLELIQLTMGDVFQKGYNLGIMVRQNEENIDILKSELGIKDDNKGSTNTIPKGDG